MGVSAKAVSKSGNRKLGGAATTYAAQETCPSSCPLRDHGCYAERGPLWQFHTQPLNLASAGRDPLEIAVAESDALDAMDTVVNRPLRHHTGGDCSSDAAARIVSAAAERYAERGGGPAWTYTHAWREVERESWRSVSVLASCETADEVRAAHERGYATALIVSSFESTKRYRHAGVDLLPCPEMTGAAASCSDCRLCFNGVRLLEEQITIGFAVHGDSATQKRARKVIADKQG